MKKILAIIDPQKDFIDGSLGVGLDKWKEAYQEIVHLIATENYDTFIVTRDWHPVNHCSFKNEGGQWPSHCVAATSGSFVYEGLLDTLLATKKPVILLDKGKDPEKEEYGIDVLLSDAEYEQLVPADSVHVVGLCYDYCVAECAKITAETHPKVNVAVVKRGTVAITDNNPFEKNELTNLKVVD